VEPLAVHAPRRISTPGPVQCIRHVIRLAVSGGQLTDWAVPLLAG
jgi:hypothetical protein